MATISGKVLVILPEVSGENERGEWVRGGIVLAPLENDQKRLALEVNGREKCDLVKTLTVGENVIVEYGVESREYQDKWYTSAKLYRLYTTQRKEASNVAEENC